MAEKVRDLRSALALLERMPDQLIETDVEVDPMAELVRSIPLCRSRRNGKASYKRRSCHDL